MKIPNSKRKKALILVDIQPVFLNKSNRYILKNIERLLRVGEYDFYINATFWAGKDSIWKKQTGWVVPKEEAETEVGILKLLKGKNVMHVTKHTKSVFNQHEDIGKVLKRKGIKEIHIVGLDTNDCVLGTTYDSFDRGFFTYVIEECVQSSDGNDMHKSALKIMRNVNLTNNSVAEKIKFINI
ncbi:MAG: Isochorismatase hydrolase [Candidatus Nomurabacteria bacterium GW2011_GWB1_37_5]|uniref:Isochorismatase hydrolase n=1 Tax=Candidatus Nomurabacteria bacterium GW2011_GWB1_37_5 TaxID=1618742 RepID=A0A0G0GVA6_9BACT|nr:MAG: Isochorismatase hydrolase [Candidatus Nomurabacteria bacterium GW2011_GWB1_37_5]